jgi:hypothetical protein
MSIVTPFTDDAALQKRCIRTYYEGEDASVRFRRYIFEESGHTNDSEKGRKREAQTQRTAITSRLVQTILASQRHKYLPASQLGGRQVKHMGHLAGGWVQPLHDGDTVQKSKHESHDKFISRDEWLERAEGVKMRGKQKESNILVCLSELAKESHHMMNRP